jgi:hypothetical protein
MRRLLGELRTMRTVLDETILEFERLQAEEVKHNLQKKRRKDRDVYADQSEIAVKLAASIFSR